MDQRIQEILKITGYDIDKYDNKKLEPIELLKKQVTYICNENNDLYKSSRNRFNELIKLKEFDIRHLTFSVLKNLVNRGEIEKELVINIINSLEDSSLEDDDFSLVEKKITENVNEKVVIWELNFFELC